MMSRDNLLFSLTKFDFRPLEQNCNKLLISAGGVFLRVYFTPGWKWVINQSNYGGYRSAHRLFQVCVGSSSHGHWLSVASHLLWDRFACLKSVISRLYEYSLRLPIKCRHISCFYRHNYISTVYTKHKGNPHHPPTSLNEISLALKQRTSSLDKPLKSYVKISIQLWFETRASCLRSNSATLLSNKFPDLSIC